eukprot:15348680-Ditylum_brightwellii.AAC.1
MSITEYVGEDILTVTACLHYQYQSSIELINAIAQVIKGQDIQDGEAAYSLVKSILRGDALQVFQNKEGCQETKDGLAFTKCFVAVTEHMFPKKAYKI